MRSLLFSLALFIVPFQTSAAEPRDIGRLRAHALSLTDATRKDYKLGALKPDALLDKTAQAHADDMARRRYFEHDSPEGNGVRDRFLKVGGDRWLIVAENLAQCSPCVPLTGPILERLHRGWMDSPGHRENILRAGVTRFGFGVASDGGMIYAVQTFSGPGAPRGMAAGAREEPIAPDAQAAEALDLVNRERRAKGVKPLAADAALREAASASLPRGGPDFKMNDIRGLLPAARRRAWGTLSIMAAECGGCGAEPTRADVTDFHKDWIADPKRRATMLDPDFTHFGFVMDADGAGRKSAAAMFGTRVSSRP